MLGVILSNIRLFFIRPFLPTVYSYGGDARGGVSFPFFVRTTIYHTILRLNGSSVGGNDSHIPFSVLFYFIITT